MEIVINKRTFVLKELNSSRRQFFVDYIFPFYNFQKTGLSEHLVQIQKQLLEKFKIEKTIDQVKKDFFKEFGKMVNQAIWIFLKDEDKKELGIVENLDVNEHEIAKLINWVSNKIKIYSEHVGSSKSETKSEDVETIYSYLSVTYGWTFDHMKEMDELQLLKAVEEAIEINKRSQVDNINSTALASAYGSGSKKAKSEIDKLNKNIKNSQQMKILRKTNPEMKMKNELSREELEKIMNAPGGPRNGR